MGIIIVCSLFFVVLFNLITLGEDTDQHLRATLAGLLVGGLIGYFIHYKFKNRLKV